MHTVEQCGFLHESYMECGSATLFWNKGKIVLKIFQHHSSITLGICELINEVRSAGSLMEKRAAKTLMVT